MTPTEQDINGFPAERDPVEALNARLVEAVSTLRENLLHAVDFYAPQVEYLLRTQSRDAQEIERLLDGLLNCACLPRGLDLFKALCRHYYFIDPTATAGYVNAYRELWEDDPEAPERAENLPEMGGK